MLQIRTHALNTFCSGVSGACQVIGSRAQHNAIDEFFEHFNLKHQPSFITNVERKGAVSANGFIKMLTFTRLGVTAYATLKLNQRESSDNLIYEFRVGQYINSIMHRFPCFVRTYNVYRVNAPGYDILRNRPNQATAAELDTMLSEFTHPAPGITRYSPQRGCHNPLYICLLTQYFKNDNDAESNLDTFLKRGNHAKVHYNLLPILYQVYFALSTLQNTFTHYDLHPGNILLCPVQDAHGNPAHVHFVYTINGENVEFDCNFIVKIIDYGRAFYYIDANTNARRDFHEIRASVACNGNNDCGTSKGFGWLEPGCPGPYQYEHGIRSSVRNKSHDLRLIDHVLWQTFNTDVRYRAIYRDRFNNAAHDFPIRIKQRLNAIKNHIHYVNDETGNYQIDAQSRHHDFDAWQRINGLGTPEQLNCHPRGIRSAPPQNTNVICNVDVAEVHLRNAVRETAADIAITVAGGGPNPFPNLFATIRCDGVHDVRFVRT